MRRVGLPTVTSSVGGMKRAAATRTSAVDAARKRKRGPTLTEQREAAEAEAASKAARKQPVKKQAAPKQSSAKKQKTVKPAQKKKPPAQKKAEEGTVSFSFQFLKDDDEDLPSDFKFGEDFPGYEMHLDRSNVKKSEWKKPISALPAEKFTFMIAAPKIPHDQWKRGDPCYDDESLSISIHLSRIKNGYSQSYGMDNDMASDVTFDDMMRSRPGKKRKWKMSWSGFGPGWVDYDVELMKGDKQMKITIVRAGLSFWPYDDDDNEYGIDRWERGYNSETGEWEEGDFDDDYEACREADDFDGD